LETKSSKNTTGFRINIAGCASMEQLSVRTHSGLRRRTRSVAAPPNPRLLKRPRRPWTGGWGGCLCLPFNPTLSAAASGLGGWKRPLCDRRYSRSAASHGGTRSFQIESSRSRRNSTRWGRTPVRTTVAASLAATTPPASSRCRSQTLICRHQRNQGGKEAANVIRCLPRYPVHNLSHLFCVDFSTLHSRVQPLRHRPRAARPPR